MNENLARWIMSSLAVYFNTVATSLGVVFFVEGVNEREEDTMNQEHVELRVNGPFVAEISKNYWRLHVDVSILLTDYMKMSSENAYDINDWGGTFLTAMCEAIPLYRNGNGPEDDGSLIGCLTLQKGVSQPVRLIHFGQISRDSRLRQSVVDGRFEMYLTL
jgi:hypothetical protein